MKTQANGTMNPQVKEMWVNALRSGDYDQSSGKLRSNTGYCCLGVLCDLYAQEHNEEWEQKSYTGTSLQMDYYYFGEESEFLPAKVMSWAGLNSNCPEIQFCDLDFDDDEELNYTNTVAELNDDGLNFHQISALIQDQL
jgi:hypothetical protein